MIVFKTTTSFRDSLDSLLSVKKDVYSYLPIEISQEFKDKTIDQIRENRDMILIQDESVVIKLRLPDHKNKWAKKNGYRLIYFVSKESELVVFLRVYPKRGPMQKIDLGFDELKSLLLEFQVEKSENKLMDYTFVEL